jgi:transcriptional regulator GlxA family with amidase domain
MTPHECLQGSRVARARDLLLTSRLSLAEIAVAAGFADQSHLSRIFRRATGMPPGLWRRRHKI